ncbi:MAG: hypothetical protein WB689_16660 [Xanthobacteraceae bacterium]
MERHDDARFTRDLADAARGGGLVGRRFAECKDVFDVIEVLDEICWVLPKAERASEPSKLTDKQMREAISLGVKMAEADALLMLERKARQVAELDRRRPRLAWDRDRGYIE